MIKINYCDLKDNMKAYMDMAVYKQETILVKRKENKNVVMLSKDAYNNLIENLYVMGNKANFDWLMESKRQLENSNIKVIN